MKIWILKSNTGEYDSETDTNLRAFANQNTAEAEVNKANAIAEKFGVYWPENDCWPSDDDVKQAKKALQYELCLEVKIYSNGIKFELEELELTE
jgi:hypothetical protein